MVPTHYRLPNIIIALGWVIFAISASGVSSTSSSGVNLFGPKHSNSSSSGINNLLGGGRHSKPKKEKGPSSCFPDDKQDCWESEGSGNDAEAPTYITPVVVDTPRKNKGVFVCWLDPIQELCMDTTMTVSDYKDLQKRVGFLSLCVCASRTIRYTHFVSKTYVPFYMKSRGQTVEQEVHVHWSQARTSEQDVEDFMKKVNERKARNKKKQNRPKMQPIGLRPGETEEEVWDSFQ